MSTPDPLIHELVGTRISQVRQEILACSYPARARAKYYQVVLDANRPHVGDQVRPDALPVARTGSASDDDEGATIKAAGDSSLTIHPVDRRPRLYLAGSEEWSSSSRLRRAMRNNRSHPDLEGIADRAKGQSTGGGPGLIGFRPLRRGRPRASDSVKRKDVHVGVRIECPETYNLDVRRKVAYFTPPPGVGRSRAKHIRQNRDQSRTRCHLCQRLNHKHGSSVHPTICPQRPCWSIHHYVRGVHNHVACVPQRERTREQEVALAECVSRQFGAHDR
ncbi:hypothetical protein EDD32_0417 [Georgenia muralis]|uniref:Uncharacterized protein n=1 Tax=Georgenia muralis TaxID=154117 RepID=A0A3N4Z4I2_9MICO|nr:hypothetical protein EDD32_0417 [Georgenia muralis]